MIVDHLTKFAHFLLLKLIFSLDRYAKLYVDEIVKLHDILVSIVADKDPRFPCRFFPSLHQVVGTTLKFSTTFHPQTDGQSERVI